MTSNEIPPQQEIPDHYNTSEIKESLEEKDLKKFKDLWEQAQGTPEENLHKYKQTKEKEYELALAEALSNNPNAINKKFELNQKENEEEEIKRGTFIDDGKPGYLSSLSTNRSIKGYLTNSEKVYRQLKDKENISYKEIFIKHQNNFTNEVLPFLIAQLRHERYMLFSHYIPAIQECKNDEHCLSCRDIQWSNITKPNFINNRCAVVYDKVHNKVKELEIPLTLSQIITIAATIKLDENVPEEFAEKTLIEQIAIGETRMLTEMDFVLHPEKRLNNDN